MGENTSIGAIKDMLSEADHFIGSKTVVGDPIKVDGATLIPLVEVSCGMASGQFSKDKGSGAGGMGIRITPTAFLVVQNGYTKLISVKNQDNVSRAMDIATDLLGKLGGKNKISKEAIEKAKKLAEEE